MLPRQLLALLWLPLVAVQRGAVPARRISLPTASVPAIPPPRWGPAVQVTPTDSSISVTEHATGYVATYFVKNVGTVNSTYTMSCSVLGALSCVSVSPTQATLSPNQQVDVDVTFATGSQSLQRAVVRALASIRSRLDLLLSN